MPPSLPTGTPGASAGPDSPGSCLSSLSSLSFVQVNYRKYDGSLHWNLRMRRLGEDGHGVWLGLPADGVTRKGHNPAISLPEAHVLLIPRASWWTAIFNAAPARTEIYCDITTPPQWPAPAEVTMVDLDLDVIRKRDADRPILVDEDEFAEHQVRYGYPPDVITSARESAQWLLTAVTTGSAPFDGTHEKWLRLVN